MIMLHYSKKSDHKQEVMASQKYAGTEGHRIAIQAKPARRGCVMCVGSASTGRFMLVSIPQYTTGFCLSFNNIEI